MFLSTLVHNFQLRNYFLRCFFALQNYFLSAALVSKIISKCPVACVAFTLLFLAGEARKSKLVTPEKKRTRATKLSVQLLFSCGKQKNGQFQPHGNGTSTKALLRKFKIHRWRRCVQLIRQIILAQGVKITSWLLRKTVCTSLASPSYNSQNYSNLGCTL